MTKLIGWAKGFLSEPGEASSKRFVGVTCALFLCYTLYTNSATVHEPSDALVYSVASLAFAALGLTSAEKIFKKPGKDDNNQNA